MVSACLLAALVSSTLAVGLNDRCTAVDAAPPIDEREIRGLAAPSDWLTLTEALDRARESGGPILVYVSAPWCGYCRKMDRSVFTDDDVRMLLERFVLARLDVDDGESRLTVQELTQSPFHWARDLGVEAPPELIFLEPDGSVITRATGYVGARALRLLLAYVATGAYRHASFDDYAREAGAAM